MRFTKMHGLGNDYIYLNCLRGMPERMPELARKLSRPHFGIGADGVICICSSDRADFSMRMFNADGSEGAMCGNGIRCVARYVTDRGLTKKCGLTIETLAGIRWVEVLAGGLVRVDMGAPVMGRTIDLSVNEITYTGVEVSMGNHHFVIPTLAPETIDLEKLGPVLERQPCFPGGVNVEFVKVADRDRVLLRVWERGSGETLACGTGACAAYAALAAQGAVPRKGIAVLPGGELELDWQEGDGHIWMTGPTAMVYEGELSEEMMEW